MTASLVAVLRRVSDRFGRNRDVYVAAGVAMMSALVLIILQKAMLSDAEFVVISIAFASASFVAVVAQLGDESDVLESGGLPLLRTALRPVLLRIVVISIIVATPFCYFNDSIISFGILEFLVFTSLFSVANWAYNLRRNQALMREDNADFRNTSLVFAVIRVSAFAALAPFLGQYALVSELIARFFLVPATSDSKEEGLTMAPFAVRKLVRSCSYSTDALVQTQTLTAISIAAATGSAATIILAIRFVFYGTGGLAQVVGTLFNRKIFQRRDVPFLHYATPGAAFALVLISGLYFSTLVGVLPPEEAYAAAGAILALLAFPMLHPLSRLFTATNREAVKLILQLLYCVAVVAASDHTGSIWPTISIGAIFSVVYVAIFAYLVIIYRRNITGIKQCH